MSVEASIASKYSKLQGELDERVRRLWAATEARELGHGGVSVVARATGLSRTTITAGLNELDRPKRRGLAPISRVRRQGGGRPTVEVTSPGVTEALEALVEPTTRGDPRTPLRWTCKSVRTLASELEHEGFSISPVKVGELLRAQGYSLQSNRKTREGLGHPDRNAQFEHIAAMTRAFQRRGQPVISVDTKKKELIGDFKNGGQEWRQSGQPERVRVHDFQDAKLGKVIPYGIYDLTSNAGWVNVGIDHDTPKFAVASIERWWRKMGQDSHPGATELLITADGGGSNGSRCRLWKVALQKLVDRTGLRITVCHFPPGTSKWNKIEHRMFCHITQNWRGRPLVSHEVVVNLIANTTTTKGLRVGATLDRRRYQTGIRVSDEELATVQLKPNRFHGEWNYAILTTKTEAKRRVIRTS